MSGGEQSREAALLHGPSTEAGPGSQFPQSEPSQETLLDFWGDTGWGGLRGLEDLKAVECLKKPESSLSPSLAGASLPWPVPAEDSECSHGRAWLVFAL